MKIIFFLSAFILVAQGYPKAFPNYDYSGDDYNYPEDNEPLVNEEEEEEIQYDINFLNIGASQIVDKGTTIKLPCNVDKYPENFVVMWKKVEPGKSGKAGAILAMGEQILSQDSRVSVEINREGDKKGSNLIIALAEDSDAGHYVCQLGSNEKKELKHTITIRDPPSIAKTPSNGLIKAHKGDDVSLSCVGSGNPKPVITWTRLNKKLPDGRDKLVDVTELSFKNVDKRHAGTYVCTANNGFGTEVKEEIRLDVEYAPEVEVEEYFIHAMENNKVELVCLVHAQPHATIQWFKNDLQLTGDDVTLERYGHKHTLTIPKLSHVDYGNYTCRAKNIHGELSKNLEVSGKAAFAQFKSEPQGQEANQFLLEWTSESQTPIEEFELMWRRENGEWEGFEVESHRLNSIHFAGKWSFSKLETATRYEAKVLAKNSEGWSRPSPAYHFATYGADMPKTSTKTKEVSGTTTVMSSYSEDIPTVVSAEAKEPRTAPGSAPISKSHHRIVTALFVILIAKFLYL